jgi:hypothetical protein
MSELVQVGKLEQVLIGGDLARLSESDRLTYYRQMCDSLQLNPLTKPFQYISLNGKLTLYATKDCTEQLRKRDAVSVQIVGREHVEGVYVVTARATLADGRCDESIGAVSIESLKGEARANAVMKAETKAKRRVTLSICGLGMLDESETESIPGAVVVVEESKQIQASAQPEVFKEVPAAVQAYWNRMIVDGKPSKQAISNVLAEQFEALESVIGTDEANAEYARIQEQHGRPLESLSFAKRCCLELYRLTETRRLEVAA